MNEFPICGCEEYKKYLAGQALSYMMAFSLLCKNEDATKATACTGPILAEKKQENKPMGKDNVIVTCRGFTGELTYLERSGKEIVSPCTVVTIYDLSIEDGNGKVAHSFTNVKLSEITFLCGEVKFGG